MYCIAMQRRLRQAGTVSPEPSLLPYTKYGQSRGVEIEKAYTKLA